MGTRWQGLLAPIDKATGDRRRMQTGSMYYRKLPRALRWQRSDQPGHDDSVVIGVVETIEIRDRESYGTGQLFDDVDPAILPRLAQDVAEAKLLLEKGVVGPSVDAGAAAAIDVVKGTDLPPTEAQWEQIWEGDPDAPELETMFTSYEIAAATLVPIPAFAECLAFELLPAEDNIDESGAEVAAEEYAALIASLTASTPVPDAALFDVPQLDGLTAFTYDAETGRVFGHLASLESCHVAYPGMCVSPPESATDYALFHRYPLDTTAGLIPVGRITTGHGRVGSGCDHTECARRDDHACGRVDFNGAVAHHDGMRTLAHVRVGIDEANGGIWFAGVAAPGIDADDLAVMGRRRVSGDWRDHAGNLELTEILALSISEPGFPLPTASMRDGRQVALVAAAPIRPNLAVPAGLDYDRLGAAVARQLIKGGLSLVGAETDEDLEESPDDEPEHTGGMIALVPSEADAARLALDGGDPVDQLHLTMAYLGDATDYDDDQRAAIVAAVSGVLAAPVNADAFSVNVFNPGSAEPDRETAIVLGISGADLDAAHTAVVDALESVVPGATAAQHAPWVAHVTLTYSDDVSVVADLVDRVGPVTFDRLRFAFAGVHTDVPLGGTAESVTAAALAVLSRAAGVVATAQAKQLTGGK